MYMGPTYEEIDANLEVIQDIGFQISMLAGMSEEEAMETQDVALEKCHKQAAYMR